MLIHGIPNTPTPYFNSAVGLHDGQGRHALSEACGPGVAIQIRPRQWPHQHLRRPSLNRSLSLLTPDLVQQVPLTQAKTQAGRLCGANGQMHHVWTGGQRHTARQGKPARQLR